MNKLDISVIEEDAIKVFNSGFNCAQAVLSSFVNYLDVDKTIALKISSGFGAGMGRLQSTCGAVTGAYMVFGLFNGDKYETHLKEMEKTYLMIQNFEDRFIQKNGTTNCRMLLNCDLRTEKGKEQFEKNNLKKAICENCIIDSINLISEEIIEKKYLQR